VSEPGLSACIRVPVRRGPRAAELGRALAAAERALPGAQLPPLEICFSRSRRFSGGYGHAGWIEISRHAEHVGLALLHELGHAVDHLVLGLGRAWGSETAALDHWWQAVKASAAFARLGRACDGDEQSYWPSQREAFARSFSQWTATRAGDTGLLQELERRASGAGRQWEREDFEPIGAALDAVLRPAA
jgi:hypothetical protein